MKQDHTRGRGLRRFWAARRASVALEAACYLCFMTFLLGVALQVVGTVFAGDILDRAAYAVAKDSALRPTAAATEQELIDRAWEAIRGEVGDTMLDPNLVRIDFAVYDNPSAMLRDELSQGANSQLGGDDDHLVVVRMRYDRKTALGWESDSLLEDPGYDAVAVARNEREIAESK